MLHWADGSVMRPRIQSYDSTFSLEPTDSITLHLGGAAVNVPSQPGVSVFDDMSSYYVSSDPGDARRCEPRPARVPGGVGQREQPAHRDVDPHQEPDSGRLHADRGDPAEVTARRHHGMTRRAGRPRPSPFSAAQRIGGGTQAGWVGRSVTWLPSAPRRGNANALPQDCRGQAESCGETSRARSPARPAWRRAASWP